MERLRTADLADPSHSQRPLETVAFSYGADVQQAASTVTAPSGVDASLVLGRVRQSRGVGQYAMGAHSTQQGYDLTVAGGTLTINPKAPAVAGGNNSAVTARSPAGDRGVGRAASSFLIISSSAPTGGRGLTGLRAESGRSKLLRRVGCGNWDRA